MKQLNKYHFTAANDFAVDFFHFDMVFALPHVLTIELQRVAITALVDIGYLETFYPSRLIEVERENIEYVVDILDAVDMTVDVDVAVPYHPLVHGFRCHGLDLSGSFDGTRVVAHVTGYGPVVDAEKVDRLAGIDINHRPHRAGITAVSYPPLTLQTTLRVQLLSCLLVL